MADTPVDLPLGYAEFRFRGKDGEGALTAKAYTYADLAKIVGFMPVGLSFEVHLYCNGVRVGNALYRRHNRMWKVCRKMERVCICFKESFQDLMP